MTSIFFPKNYPMESERQNNYANSVLVFSVHLNRCSLKTEYQIIRYYPAAGKSMPATSAVRHNPLMRGAINTCREYWAAPICHETQQSNDTSAQPQLHAMGAARSDPRRGVIPMRQEQPAA
jgi:hypothetical protein